MDFLAALRRAYHGVIPLALRRQLRLSRWTSSRRARLRVWTQTEGRVAAGPFAGMRLRAAVPGECEGAVLLGSFECETHEWLRHEFSRAWRAAVNVGSAGGFYATGLALRLPSAIVHAFEIAPEWQVETRLMAELNGVDARVLVHGGADVSALAALPINADDGALVVCDCEGCERDLLDPERVPWLRWSALCVELHDFAAPGASATLRERFSATHDITIVAQQPRDPMAWATQANISVADASELCDEARRWGDDVLIGQWMLATPRQRS